MSLSRWKVLRTLLIVGEGRSEEAFLHHVRQFCAPQGCGLKVTIKNAKGKGAKHVVEWTARQAAIGDFDLVATLLDTDTDWTPAVAKFAKQKKIRVLASDPCLEAMLLRVLKQSGIGDTKALKYRFAPYVSGDSTQRGNYATHFHADCLEEARGREPTIDGLLRLFGK